MSGKRRKHSREFKLQVTREAEAGTPAAELCRRYELSPSLVVKWRKQVKDSPHNPFPGQGSRHTDMAHLLQMERLIGRQALEIDFLKNALRRLKGKET